MRRQTISRDYMSDNVRLTASLRRAARYSTQFLVERLEDRTLFAFNLTLSNNVTMNVTASTVANTTTFTAANINANLRWADIANQLILDHNVVISTGPAGAQAGDITDQLVGGITIPNAAGTHLIFQTGSGPKLVGNVSLGAFTLMGVAAVDVLAAGNINVQALQQSGQLVSAALTSAGGTINGAMNAQDLSLSAASGLGSSGTPIVTRTINLAARTASGGIFITNTGNLTIGFPGEPFAGVQVTGGSGDVHLTSAGVFSVTRSGDVIKGPGDVAVASIGAADDLLIGTGDGLASAAGGSVVSTGSSSTVSLTAGRDLVMGNPFTLAGGDVQSAGSISLTAGRNISVNDNSFIDAHGAGTLNATAGGNISLLQSTANQGARLTTTGGAISLATGAGGTFTANSGNSGFNTGGVLSTQNNGNGPITISADDMAITDDTISAGSSSVTLQQATTTQHNIDLGGGTSPGDLNLSDAELAHVTAGVLRIGRADNFGSILITAPVTVHPGYSTLTLRTPGSILDKNTNEPDIRVANLALRTTAVVSLDTAVSTLAFSNAAGAMSIDNAGALTIGAVDGLTSSTNTGTTTTLTASSPITFAVTTTSAGTLSAATSETASETTTPLPPPDDDITVNPGVTVQSTGGDVYLRSADGVIVNNTSRVLAPSGNISLSSGDNGMFLNGASRDNDNDAAMVLSGVVAASSGNGTVDLIGEGAAVTETVTGTISGAGLVLEGTGPFSLDASTTNLVTTIAGDALLGISFRNAGPLIVGAVKFLTGTFFSVISDNGDVTLSTTAGDITLNDVVGVGSGGTVRLQAAGAVMQTAAQIKATNLGVRAGGNISLVAGGTANEVNAVALITSGGTVSFQDDSNLALTVGTVTASGAFSTAVSGITATADVTLCSAGALTITQPIIAGANTVRLQSAGTMVQTASGTITAANLGVVAAGSVGLAVAGAPNNISGIFAANTSGGPAGSFVQLLSAGPVTVGTVTATTCFAGASGVQTNAGNVDLQVQGAGTLTLAQPINAGAATVRLGGGGGVVQVASGPITAMNLAVIGAGNIDLSPAPNLVSGMFAAQNSGAGAVVRFNDGAALTVGSVASDAVAAGAVGITTDSGDVDLVESGGALTLAAPINAGATGVIRLQSAAAVSQLAAGPLNAAGLSVTAAGNVTLGQLTNSIGTFAALLSGSGSALSLATSAGFTVGAIGGDALVPPRNGISAAGNVTLVPNSGILTISADISAAMLTLWPQSGGVDQTGGTITAAALIQPAGAAPSTYAGSIFTGAGGLQLTASDFSMTGPINLNSGPLTMADTGSATISGPISGSGGLVMSGPGMLTLAAANTYTGTTTVTAGTLIVAAAGALPAVQNVVNNGALQINANSSPGSITGTGSLSVNTALLAIPSFSQGAVAIQGLGTLKLQAASPTTSTASSLSIDTGSKLDMTTNSVRINYSGSTDPIASIRSYLSSGYAGGTWSGNGIVTSAGDSTHALGFGDSADGVVPGLTANTILIRFTRVGDVNLDGVVGFADLITVARNYGKTGRNWDQGDINYDGAVGFDDLLAVARNYGATAALEPVSAMSLPSGDLPFGRRKRR